MNGNMKGVLLEGRPSYFDRCCLMCGLFGSDCLYLCIPDSVEERACGLRHCYIAQQNAASGDVVAVDGFGGIVIAANCSAGQRESGKGASGTRVRQDLGFQLPIRVGRSIAPYRSSRRRGIRSVLELAGEQLQHSLVILNDHDQVHAFDADLQSPASASDSEECRRASSDGGSAGGNASPIFRAKHKAALEHVGRDGNALCVFEDFFRNTLVGRRHDLMEHCTRMVEPIGCCFAISCRPAHARQTE
jgi:hypothetical protein